MRRVMLLNVMVLVFHAGGGAEFAIEPGEAVSPADPIYVEYLQRWNAGDATEANDFIRSKEHAAIPALIALLKDPSPTLREQAGYSIMRLGDEAITAMAPLFNSDNPTERATAVKTLVRSRHAVARPFLLAAYRDDAEEVKVAAASASWSAILTEEDWDSVVYPFLVRSLAVPDDALRKAAILGLASSANRQRKKRLPALAERIVPMASQDPSSAVRAAVMHNLLRFCDDEELLIPLFIQGLQNPDQEIRRHTVSGLGMGELVHPDILKQLIDTLRNEEVPIIISNLAYRIRGYGAEAEAAVPVLIAALACDDLHVHRAVAKALADIGTAPEVCIPALKKSFEDYGHSDTEKALEAFGVEPDLGVGYLRRLLKYLVKQGEMSEERMAALTPENPETYTFLFNRLLDENAHPNRVGAAHALRSLANTLPPETVPMLEEALAHDSEMIRYQAFSIVTAMDPATRAWLPGLQDQCTQAGLSFEAYCDGEKVRLLIFLLKSNSPNYALSQLKWLGAKALPAAQDVTNHSVRTGFGTETLIAMGPQAHPYLYKAAHCDKRKAPATICAYLLSLETIPAAGEAEMSKAFSRASKDNVYAAIYPVLKKWDCDFNALLLSLAKAESWQKMLWLVKRLNEDAASFSDEIQDSMLAAVRRNDFRHRSLVEAYALMDPQRALPLYLEKLDQFNTPIAEYVARFGAPALEPLTAILLEDPDRHRRYSASRALSMMDPAITVQCLDHESYQIAYALSRAAEAPPKARRILDTSGKNTFLHAQEVLLPVLVEALQQDSHRLRRRAALTLSVCDASREGYGIYYVKAATPYLIACLDDPDPGVQAIAARGLMERYQFQALPALRDKAATLDTASGLYRIVDTAIRELTWMQARNGAGTNGVPELELVHKEVTSDWEAHRKFMYFAQIDDQRIFLGDRYELFFEGELNDDQRYRLEREKAKGLDTESWGGSWLIPERLLSVHATNVCNYRLDMAVNTTILLLKDGADWREIFRDTVPGYSGLTMSNSESLIKFRWNEHEQRLDLMKTYRVYDAMMETDPSPKELVSSTIHNEQWCYFADYSLETVWPCTIQEGALALQPGVVSLVLGEQEYPIQQVVDFMNARTPGLDLTVEQLQSLNPQLQGERLCTGTLIVNSAATAYQHANCPVPLGHK